MQCSFAATSNSCQEHTGEKKNKTKEEEEEEEEEEASLADAGPTEEDESSEEGASTPKRLVDLRPRSGWLILKSKSCWMISTTAS